MIGYFSGSEYIRDRHGASEAGMTASAAAASSDFDQPSYAQSQVKALAWATAHWAKVRGSRTVSSLTVGRTRESS